MSIPDLEARMRLLRLEDPAPALGEKLLREAAKAGRLTRWHRRAWAAAAAAAVLTVAVAWTEPARPATPVPTPEVPADLAEFDPGLSSRMQCLAMAAPKLEAGLPWKNRFKLLEGDLP